MILVVQERRIKAPTMSESELEALRAQQALANAAQKEIDEQKDQVKAMNQLMLYAKCVTIRDKQKEEKEMMKAEIEQEEKRLAVMMEVERLKQIKLLEERETTRYVCYL
jgi:hypothetical protein